MYSEDFDRNIVVPIPFIEIGPQLPDYYVDWEGRVEWQQSIEEARREEFEDFATAQDYWKRSLTPYNWIWEDCLCQKKEALPCSGAQGKGEQSAWNLLGRNQCWHP